MSDEHSFLYIKEETETPRNDIEIRSKKVDDTTLLYPRNIQRLDDVNAVPFYQRIKSYFLPGRKIILSLAKLKSIDSQGLALLVQLTQLAKKQKCRFALAEIPPPLTRILRITEIDKLLKIVQTNNKGRSISTKAEKTSDTSQFHNTESDQDPDVEIV